MDYPALNNLFITLVSSAEVSAVQTPSLFVVPIEKYELFPDILMEVVIYALAGLIMRPWGGTSGWSGKAHGSSGNHTRQGTGSGA